MENLSDLLGESPAIVATREQIARLIARHRQSRRLPPILVQGETGTGKGLAARAIHRSGPRAEGPFVDVNCAAIPETLLEAELFGYERGAFTDARQAKPGLFQAAHRGTLFLDEVGLLPEALQAKLLTVIEERVVRRLGSTHGEPVDVWIIAATNADLRAATAARRFREDLYHRLAVFTVTLPPLRERGVDVLLLAEHFLARVAADYGLGDRRLAADARLALGAYPWPGNIRELSNVIERVALLSDAHEVTAAMLMLPAALSRAAAAPVASRQAGPGDGDERDRLRAALEVAGWNISRAAAALGISRNAIRYRMEKHGLRPGTAEPPAERVGAPEPLRPATPEVPAVEAPPPVMSGGVRWERRRLTWLRVELPLLDGARSPLEGSRELEVSVDKVRSFGGRVEEMSPSGLVAAFGIEPVEDAPLRAAHAAMAIVKAVGRSRGGESARGGMRIAIHVGQFLIGQLPGRGAADSLGVDPEDKRAAWALLAELTAGAEPGGIAVSAAAAAVLERRFELALAGEPRSSGPAVYRLVGRERTALPGGRTAPLVGRGQELALLAARLAWAQRGRGQVVGLVGEPGIGKSRLLAELRHAAGAPEADRWDGQCLADGSAVPYRPIVDLLRAACGLGEHDPPDQVAARLRDTLGTLGVDGGPADAYLLALLGADEHAAPLARLSPEAIRTGTFESLLALCLAAGRRRPLVLAIDNVQWIDRTSEEFLEALIERLAAARILLVLAYRPGYRPPGLDRSYTTQLALPPLDPEESLRLVRALRPSDPVPAAVAATVVAEGEGNPFFLEELALAMADHGDRVAAGEVPDTIQEMLMARLARLPDEPRRLLGAASVLGRDLPVHLLRAIAPWCPDLVRPLRELLRRELLDERTGGERPVLAFRHLLTQEVAYQSLVPAERSALHRLAAEAIESLGTGRREDAGLAYHFARGGDSPRAVSYLVRAAERSARAYAHTEALAMLTEAAGHAARLPVGERDRTTLEVALRQAHSLSFLGRFPEALELLRGERERVQRMDDLRLSGLYHFWLAHTSSYLGDQEQAQESATRALAEAERCGDRATAGRAALVLAQESYWAGRPLEGIERGRRAIALLDGTEERWWLGLAHWVVGINHVIVGDFTEALAAVATAGGIGEALGDPRLQSYAAWTTGWIRTLGGDPEAGIEACRGGLKRSPDLVNTAVVLGHLGYAHLEQGNAGEAIRLLEQAVGEMRRFRARPLEGRFLTFLGEAYLLAGDAVRARDLVTQGLRVTREARYWYGMGWAQLALGRVEQVEGAFDAAGACLVEARATFRRVGARFMVARSELALAELAEAAARPAAAGPHLVLAHRVFRELGVPRLEDRAATLAARLSVPLTAPLDGAG